MSLSKKRKKELQRLQASAAQLWEAQQVVLSGASDVAREAGRQLGNYNREHIAPVVDEKYHEYVAPVVDRVTPYVDESRKASKHFLDRRVVPVVGDALGKALSAIDAANDARAKFAGKAAPVVEPQKKKGGAGAVIALILGLAAAGAVLYAAWQTLRADDELWVADDPLASPDA